MRAVILAGGVGSRLSEETRIVPKPMVRIGDRPIIWHIMNHYASYGVTDFVVALGYKGYVIKEYFANYQSHEADFTVNLRTGAREYISAPDVDWTVTLVDTGLESMTGGRLKRVAPYLGERFMLTYGDGLSDVNLHSLLRYHEQMGATATVTAVRPAARFGAISIRDGYVNSFSEKPAEARDRINGGFFVMETAFLERLTDDSCVLERAPLAGLAEKGGLAAYEHDGFWMPMDTLREKDELEAMWATGQAPWLRR